MTTTRTTRRSRYSVVQPIESGPTRLITARVISRHRTREAAQQAIERAAAALRRQPGTQNSYYDWHIRKEG